MVPLGAMPGAGLPWGTGGPGSSYGFVVLKPDLAGFVLNRVEQGCVSGRDTWD
jgi:hypothetical protein